MDMATITPRLLLVRSQRPAGRPAAGAHLHFDRGARVWREHDERHALEVTAATTAWRAQDARDSLPAPVSFQECA